MLIILSAGSVEISSDDDAMSVKSTKSTKRYPIILSHHPPLSNL